MQVSIVLGGTRAAFSWALSFSYLWNSGLLRVPPTDDWWIRRFSTLASGDTSCPWLWVASRNCSRVFFSPWGCLPTHICCRSQEASLQAFQVPSAVWVCAALCRLPPGDPHTLPHDPGAPWPPHSAGCGPPIREVPGSTWVSTHPLLFP